MSTGPQSWNVFDVGICLHAFHHSTIPKALRKTNRMWLGRKKKKKKREKKQGDILVLHLCPFGFQLGISVRWSRRDPSKSLSDAKKEKKKKKQ